MLLLQMLACPQLQVHGIYIFTTIKYFINTFVRFKCYEIDASIEVSELCMVHTLLFSVATSYELLSFWELPHEKKNRRMSALSEAVSTKWNQSFNSYDESQYLTMFAALVLCDRLTRLLGKHCRARNLLSRSYSTSIVYTHIFCSLFKRVCRCL